MSAWQGRQDYPAIGRTALLEIAETLGIDPNEVDRIVITGDAVTARGMRGQTLRMRVHNDINFFPHRLSSPRFPTTPFARVDTDTSQETQHNDHHKND